MKFGIFYEHQLPRPWGDDGEHRLIQEALDQVEFADEIGIDYAWEVEHHFLEEYSHSSAPEVFLAACSQRTQNIRLGHGIVQMPPNFNHPARVAERIAMLDLVSNGRVEFGTGEASARLELGGFNIDPREKRAAWKEAVRECSRMMTMAPYPGYEGQYFSMPCRNVVPKPLQKPHPPMWVACSNRNTIHLAAQLGLGALSFAFINPEEARHWVTDYYETLKNECVPISEVVNPNIAMVTGFSCHEDQKVAEERGLEGFQFFGYALGHFYAFGQHIPGRTDVWKRFQEVRGPGGTGLMSSGGIGTPDRLRDHFKSFQDVGVDQVVFIQQGGNNKHADIISSLDLFAKEVMPEFKEGEADRERKKMEDLAPYIEKAFERRRAQEDKGPEFEPPVVPAYGRTIAEGTGGRRSIADEARSEA